MMTKDYEEDRPKVVIIPDRDEPKREVLKLSDISPVLKGISASELLKLDIPDLEYAAEKILPLGSLGLLSSAPKNYKTFMCFQLALAVTTGTKFLNFNTTPLSVIYFDLESGKRRPRDRIRVMLEDLLPPENLFIITADEEVGTLATNFIEILTEQIEFRRNVGLVVIDVFQKIRSSQKRGQNAYDFDYQDMRQLKQVCEQFNVSILLVHHNRKMKDSDPFNEMTGSTGLLGAVDFCWIIQKERNSDDAILHVTGRDIESTELAIRFNHKRFKWEYEGTKEESENRRLIEEYEKSNVVATIKKLVQDNNGKWSGRVTDIKRASAYIGIEIYDSENNIGKQINRFEELLLIIDKIKIDRHKESHTRQRLLTFYCL